MSCLALIPARGGSKGIPGKNIRPLAGKPLLAYTIEQARQTAQINRVIVSTDEAGISAVARQCGAEVIERPPEISGDSATSESALRHALEHLRQTEGYEPELVVFLQATSPLRQPTDIQQAIETFQREGADSLFSAGPVHGFVWRNSAGELSSLSYDHRHRPRRQDTAEELIENGSIYIFRPWVLEQHNNRLGGKIAVHRMYALDSFQVDEPGDFELMEQLLQYRRLKAPAPDLGRVRLLALDFDGVMTDNRVLVDETGREAVVCNRSDGLGIAQLKQAGIEVIVISTETNPVVAARCQKLKIECVQGLPDKLAALRAIASRRALIPDEIAYVGNDVNDLACMRWAGVPIAVADAMPEVSAAARRVATRAGGEGAVREVCDWILDSRGGATYG